MGAPKSIKLYSHGIYTGLYTKQQVINMTGITLAVLERHIKNDETWQDRWKFDKIEVIPKRLDEQVKKKLLKDYEWDKLRKKLNPYAKGTV